MIKKTSQSADYEVQSREEGIRTLETLPFTRFPGVRLRPLGHLSK